MTRADALRALLEKVEVGEWREIPKFPGYFVSETGIVWSARKNDVLARNPHTAGYPMVHLIDANGKRRTRKVHVLVAAAFLGPRPKGCDIRHLDGDKTNSRKGNLSYGTRSQNILDRKRHDLPKSYRLRPDDVLDIRRKLRDGLTQTQIAAEYGVHRCTIGDIYRGKRHADI